MMLTGEACTTVYRASFSSHLELLRNFTSLKEGIDGKFSTHLTSRLYAN